MGISFKLDISASELSGNNTFFIIGKDRSTYSLNNESSFSGFVQELYYQVGDTIEISFNSNARDISFFIFDSSNTQETKFIFDKNKPKYTISFENYSDYRFGFLKPDGSFIKYGIFNSYILTVDTRDDLNSYISSKYTASDKRNRLQQFNRDDRRFIGNYDYIKSDATRIGVDSYGVNNDLIIQSVRDDIHIVTGDKQRTTIWGNLQVNGNIYYTGMILKQDVEGTNSGGTNSGGTTTIAARQTYNHTTSLVKDTDYVIGYLSGDDFCETQFEYPSGFVTSVASNDDNKPRGGYFKIPSAGIYNIHGIVHFNLNIEGAKIILWYKRGLADAVKIAENYKHNNNSTDGQSISLNINSLFDAIKDDLIYMTIANSNLGFATNYKFYFQIHKI